MCITVDELLELAEENGFEPAETQGWFKIGHDRGPRVYVRRPGADGRAREIHLSGFTLDDARVEQLTPQEARARHLGRVRGIIGVPGDCDAGERGQLLALFQRGLTVVQDGLPAPRVAAVPPTPHEQGDPTDVPESVLRFRGYGQPAAPLWLIGIEEGFGGRLRTPHWSVERELEARSRWDPVMDARDACETLEDRYWERRDYSPVWRNAAKISRALVEDAADWQDVDLAHQYVVEQLGRRHGQTFLGELFPLPAIGLDHWPYQARWPDRASYRLEVWPGRLDLWRDAIAAAPARTVICYGAEARRYAAEAFDVDRGRGIASATVNGRRIVMAPFIGSFCSGETLAAIVAATRAR
jgi:hypothetical protein